MDECIDAGRQKKHLQGGVIVSRLIDADATKRRVADTYFDALIPCVNHALDDSPTVDAVHVVRCRECKHWGDEDGKLQRSDGVLFARCKIHNYLLDGRHTGWCPTENDFCSYGERKEGAENG